MSIINYNGELLHSEKVGLDIENRAFKYGDSVFETIKVIGDKIIFLEDHYFRLMASMRMLRMKIPMKLTLDFLKNDILKTIKEQEKSFSYRVRLTIFRKKSGLYAPLTNEIDYIIEVKKLNYTIKSTYILDVYKDFYNYSGLLSTIKTNNKILNVLAGIFKNENNFDNCVLLNENKNIVEVINGNIFLVKNNIIKTPALKEGCVRGVVRKKIIEMLTKSNTYEIEETSMSSFELQKSDEVFITNSIIGVQPVTSYKKKTFVTEVSNKISNSLKLLQATSD